MDTALEKYVAERNMPMLFQLVGQGKLAIEDAAEIVSMSPREFERAMLACDTIDEVGQQSNGAKRPGNSPVAVFGDDNTCGT